MIPNITQNDIFWEGKIQLDNWNKFYGEELNLILNIGGDCIIDEVTKIHENGYNYLISKQQNMLEVMLDTVYEHYSTWQEEYGYAADEKELLMPDIFRSVELKTLLYPEKVFIMDIEVNEVPYIGVQFRCKWDEEHGVGLMFYKDRVVKVGGSDTAFMNWIAEEDKENM